MDENGSVATGAASLVVAAGPDPTGGVPAGTPVTAAPVARPLAQVPAWPRLGAATRTSTTSAAALPPTGPAEVPGGPVDISLEIEDGETTLFEAAINAFHAGEFPRAESLFLEEAQRSLDTAPQRAAIAYRQAALAAGQTGNVDASDHWMRLAGREYLRVTEDDRTPLPFIREAAVMAARCFLSVENLGIASKGLRRAQAIERVLSADDDLMAQSAEPAGADEDDADTTPATPGLRLERRATVRRPSDVDPSRSASPPARGPGTAPVAGQDPPAGRPGWRHRLRHPRTTHRVA